MKIRHLNDTSLKTKFNLLPIVASVFLLALILVFLLFTHQEKKLLEHIQQQTLTRSDDLYALQHKLSRNHGELFVLLASIINLPWDEQRIYVEGKPKLYTIHEIEAALEKIPNVYHLRDGERDRFQLLQKRLAEYKSEAIAAIEMATVNLSLANDYMINANAKYMNTADELLALLDSSRSNAVRLITQSREAFIKKTAVGVVITVTGVCMLMFISVRT